MNSANRLSPIVNPTSTLMDCLKKMDEIRSKLLLVLENEFYVGLLSIGDIQRAIIANKPNDTKISTILRNDYIVAYEGTNTDEIKKIMLKIRAEFIPVISKNNKVIRIFYWDELFLEKRIIPENHFDIPVVIMAGGLGTRLRPFTYVIPKPILPYKEKTILEEVISRFNNYGCKDFYLSVNYKADLIEYYIKSLNLPYNFTYVKELIPMGTIGSLSLVKNKIKQTFFLHNCDILIEQDYSEILKYHLSNKNEITLVSAIKNYSIPYGILESGEDGLLLDIQEKPEITFKINSGMYIIEPHLLQEIPDSHSFDITNLIENIRIRNGRIGVFPISDKSWIDIGNLTEFSKMIGINNY